MKPKIVLISVYNPQNIGIQNIYFELLNKGFDAYIIHFGEINREINGIKTVHPSKKDYILLINLLNKIKPEIIGISSTTYSFGISIQIIDIMKREMKNSLILIGGVHAKIMPEECIKYADAVCIGEGDESVPELCSKFFLGEDYSNIPNFWIKRDNKIIKNPIKFVEDLDKLVFPNFDIENVFYIIDGNLIKNWVCFKGVYETIFSRGCFFKCTYCINSNITTRYRRKSVERVIKELKIVKNRFSNLKFINVNDEVFNLDLIWLEKFCELYKKEINIPFYCQLHPSLITEKALILLKEAGLSFIAFDIQSGSKRIREEIYGRFTSNELIYNKYQLLRKHNIKFECGIIINNPLETDEDLRENIRFLLSLRPITLKLFSLTNYPKTKLTERLLKEGMIEKADTSLDTTFYFRVSKKQPFRNRRDEYWYYIINFISKSFIPNSFIILLTKDLFVKNNKYFINIFRLGNKFYELKERLVNLVKGIKNAQIYF